MFAGVTESATGRQLAPEGKTQEVTPQAASSPTSQEGEETDIPSAAPPLSLKGVLPPSLGSYQQTS